MKQISLSELALELGVNKSMLAYYSKLGLIKPIATVGRMKIFDREKTMHIIKRIIEAKKAGLSLSEILAKR
jgi:DNA-binding transcriptional MerR regulator